MIQIYLLQKSMKKINWLEYQELTPEEKKKGGGIGCIVRVNFPLQIVNN